MNFAAFRDSKFLRYGKLRHFVSDKFDSFYSEHSAYDIADLNVSVIETNNILSPDFIRPSTRKGIFSANHLVRSLEITEPWYMPFEFKQMLVEQWKTVDSIIKPHKHLVNGATLLIQRSGSICPTHLHDWAAQTTTFCYTMNDGSEPIYDKNLLTVDTRDYEFPADTFCVQLPGSVPHSVTSNKWCFWWIYDTTEKITVDLSNTEFTYFSLV